MMKKWSLVVAATALSAISAPLAADVQTGFQAWERGDYKTAVAEWRKAALQGDPVAQFNLGQAYKLGRGVEMDHNQALSWFKRAADQGHIEAFDNYGLLLFNLNRRAEAMPYIETSAARGEARAQYVLGTALFNGDLANKDWPRAYALMTRASSKGLAQASARLADLDKLIPIEDRQRGLQMAASMEASEGRAQLAMLPAIGTSRPSSPRPAASGPGASYVAPPLDGANAVASVKQKSPAKAPGVKTPAAPAVTKPKPTPPKAVAAKAEPAKSAPKAVASTGPWTAQIGAFSSQSNAASLWSRISGKAPFSGYNPRYVNAGAVVRVQVGAFPSREAAVKFCAAAKSSAPGCFPMKR